MNEQLDISKSSVQAVAEEIHARLAPHQTAFNKYEREDIIEVVRNCYLGVAWDLYIQLLNDGDRLLADSMLQTKCVKFDGTGQPYVTLKDISIVSLPRDAGIYQVIPVDDNCLPTGKPLTKTNQAMQGNPPKISPGPRYFRIDNKIWFPDGLPGCGATGVQVSYIGLDLTDEELQYIPRELASKTRTRAWAELAPSDSIRSDITTNENPNE